MTERQAAVTFSVQKLLSNYGYCSRRKAEQLVRRGAVTVNGRVVSVGDRASKSDRIHVHGRPVKAAQMIYLMLNKPLFCVTSLGDKHHRTVMDYIKVKQRVFPVGRLDYDTSGLLLFTNDGDFANRIMHPRYQVNKTYLVETDKLVSAREISMIESGVELEDGKTSQAKIKRRSPTLLEVTIHEGRKRLVRRIFEKLGYRVKSLKRVRIGRLTLGDLKPGTCRSLTKEDIEKVFSGTQEGLTEKS